MKRMVIVLVTLLLAAGTMDLQAQWLKKLGQKAVERAEDRAKRKVEKKVDDAVDKTVDDAFEGTEGAVKGKGQKDKPDNKDAKKNDDSKGNEPEETRGAAQSGQQSGKYLEAVYAKSDFVPGDEIIFDDDVASEQMGEFPSKWDLREGIAEVMMLDGSKCINLQNTTVVAPLMKEPYSYLPEIFTVELDLFFFGEKRVELNDSYILSFWSGEGSNDLGFEINIRPSFEKDVLNFSWNWNTPIGESRYGELKRDGMTHEEFHHLSISFNKRALKIYVDGIRIANVPNARKPNWFYVRGYGDSNKAYFIKNVRIAKGAVPLYDRMMSEGKFITYGITFDVGKEIIKPESMGEINRIVQLMTENPELRFSVEGHTDSTGNVANNQTLSEARSKAIVDKLVGLGISAERLTAVGKGQASPIADNGTDEGRAKNRRVEFVKQ